MVGSFAGCFCNELLWSQVIIEWFSYDRLFFFTPFPPKTRSFWFFWISAILSVQPHLPEKLDLVLLTQNRYRPYLIGRLRWFIVLVFLSFILFIIALLNWHKSSRSPKSRLLQFRHILFLERFFIHLLLLLVPILTSSDCCADVALSSSSCLLAFANLLDLLSVTFGSETPP